MAAIQLLNKLNLTPAPIAPAPKPQASAPAAPTKFADCFVRSAAANTAPRTLGLPTAAKVGGDQPVNFNDLIQRNPSLIWSTSLSPRTEIAMQAFKRGFDAKGQVYGASVKGLNLANQTAEGIRGELTKRGFKTEKVDLKNVHTGEKIINPKTGKAVPMEIWTHKDGGMVRVKPEGDPSSKFRPQPHVSVSVKYPPDATSHDFNNEAFKVDIAGNALPKWAADARNPFPSDTPAGKQFLDDLASRTHINLR